METSIFIAQLLGPIMLLIGIRLLFSSNLFQEVKKWYKNDSFGIFFISILGVLGGLLMVLNHNIWELSWVGIITFIGWAMLIKSSIILAFPKIYEKLIDNISFPNGIIKSAGVLYILIGAYLIYISFM